MYRLIILINLDVTPQETVHTHSIKKKNIEIHFHHD